MDTAVKVRRGLISFVKYALLLFAAFVALVPIVSCVITAFKSVEEYQNTNVMLLPKSWTYFENFKTAWQQADMGSAFLHSFFIVACVLVGSVFISAMLAYVLNRFRFHGNTLIRNLFTIATLIPGIASQVTVYQIMTALGLVNTMHGYIILMLGTDVITIYIFLQFFENLPVTLDESAIIDGCTYPCFMERLGVNAVFNAGALKRSGKYYLVARVEGSDRKSFFAVAESSSPTEGFRFWDYPVQLPDAGPAETNVYDMRLTQHEDGWIYGVFCSESKDTSNPDLSAAVAEAGIVRTKDLKTWERLPNLVTRESPQQRNVCLLPEFVNGQYAFFTRPMDGFIDTGSGGGVGFGLCGDITHAVIDHERITSPRRYHTITESKNGAGAAPIKTPAGWLHIAHGVRNTAAGLRYVVYVFMTSLSDPAQVIAEPSGFLIAPRGDERVGDVSNVAFSNGAIVDDDGSLYIYYASADTRLHVASTTVERMVDYALHTPADPLWSADCVRQRCGLIDRNLAYLRGENR